MALLIRYKLTLEDSDFVDKWLRYFAARPRPKKLKDDQEKGGENDITDAIKENKLFVGETCI